MDRDTKTLPPGPEDAAAEKHLLRLCQYDREQARKPRSGLIHDLAVEYFTRPVKS